MAKSKTSKARKISLKGVSDELKRVHTSLVAQRASAPPAAQKRIDLKIKEVESLRVKTKGMCAGAMFIFRPPFFAKPLKQK